MKSFLKLIVLLLSFLCITSHAQTWHPMCANGSGNGGLHNSTWQKLNGAAAGGGTWKPVGTCATRMQVNLYVTSNTLNLVLGTSSVSGYIAGQTDVTLTVNSGVVVGSISYPSNSVALTVDSSWNASDTVTIVNNGFIVGYGGNGGNSWFSTPARGEQGGVKITSGTAGYVGGIAMSLLFPTTIINNNVIGGGGGGGGGGGNVTTLSSNSGGGGGGAGYQSGVGAMGGSSGTVTSGASGNGQGGAGGGLGSNGNAGANGTNAGLPGGAAGACTSNFYSSHSVWNGNACYGVLN